MPLGRRGVIGIPGPSPRGPRANSASSALPHLAGGADVDRNEPMPVELLDRSGPGPALLELRADHQRRVRQRIDELVALHRVSDQEACGGVVRADQGQAAVHQRVAVPPARGGAFEAVGQDARHRPAGVQRAPHRGLIDAAGASRDQRATRLGGQSTDALGVGDQVVVHVPRADDGQAPRVEVLAVPATVQHRRRLFPQALLQPPRVLRVRSARDPERARTPALHRLAEEEAPVEQTAEPLPVQVEAAFLQQLPSAIAQQIGGLPSQLPEPTREAVVLTGGQRLGRRSPSPSDAQRRSQQEDRPRVQRRAVHDRPPAFASASGHTGPHRVSNVMRRA